MMKLPPVSSFADGWATVDVTISVPLKKRPMRRSSAVASTATDRMPRSGRGNSPCLDPTTVGSGDSSVATAQEMRTPRSSSESTVRKQASSVSAGFTTVFPTCRMNSISRSVNTFSLFSSST
jgi:hypothetical protein